MNDAEIHEVCISRLVDGWRPSQYVPATWERVVYYNAVGTKAPEPEDPEVPDPEREPMTDEESRYLLARGATMPA